MFHNENEHNYKKVDFYTTYLFPYGKKLNKSYIDEFMEIYKAVGAVRIVCSPKNADAVYKHTDGKHEISVSRGVSLNELWAAVEMTEKEFQAQQDRFQKEREAWNEIWGGQRGGEAKKPRTPRSKKVQVLVTELQRMAKDGLTAADIAKSLRRDRKINVSKSQVQRALDGKSERGYLLVAKIT